MEPECPISDSSALPWAVSISPRCMSTLAPTLLSQPTRSLLLSCSDKSHLSYSSDCVHLKSPICLSHPKTLPAPAVVSVARLANPQHLGRWNEPANHRMPFSGLTFEHLRHLNTTLLFANVVKPRCLYRIPYQNTHFIYFIKHRCSLFLISFICNFKTDTKIPVE